VSDPVTRVLVLGATGELGQRVCRLIQRWLPTAQLMGANRSGRGHPDFPVQPTDIASEIALAPHVAAADLVINAVGPYHYSPAPVVRACVQGRCHYADLAEDRRFVRAVTATARAAGAKNAGIAVVPGASTVPGLVELLASRWAERSDVAGVRALLSLGSRNPASRGLLSGLLAPLGRPRPEGGRWFERLHRWRTGDGRSLRFGSYPAPFDDGLALGSRRVPAAFYMGFDRALLTRTLQLAAPMLGRAPESAIPRMAAAALPLARLLAPLGSTRGVLAVVAESADGEELARVEVHAVANGLDIPAAPPLWIAQRLAAGGIQEGGARSLAGVVSRQEAELWLTGAGYTIRES
jgi:hypothetical protein